MSVWLLLERKRELMILGEGGRREDGRYKGTGPGAMMEADEKINEALNAHLTLLIFLHQKKKNIYIYIYIFSAFSFLFSPGVTRNPTRYGFGVPFPVQYPLLLLCRIYKKKKKKLGEIATNQMSNSMN